MQKMQVTENAGAKNVTAEFDSHAGVDVAPSLPELPIEVLTRIAAKMRPQDWQAASATCSGWRQALRRREPLEAILKPTFAAKAMQQNLPHLHILAESEATLRRNISRGLFYCVTLKAKLDNHKSYCVAFSPDETRLAMGLLNGCVALYHLRHYVYLTNRLQPLGVANGSLRFSDCGNHLIYNAAAAQSSWDVRQRIPLRTDRHLTPTLAHTPVSKAANRSVFSADGQALACAGDGGHITLYTFTSAYTKRRLRHTGLWRDSDTLYFSANAEVLVKTTQAGPFYIWHLKSDRAGGLKKHAQEVASPRGLSRTVTIDAACAHLAKADSTEAIRIWDLNALARPPTVISTFPGMLTSLTFAPSGRTLVSIAADGTVRIYNFLLPLQLLLR